MSNYLDFCPPGKPGIKFQPQLEVDPTNLASRRAHMEAFFKHMGGFSKEKLTAKRKHAERIVCVKLLKRTAPPARVGVRHFELYVDWILWFDWFKESKDRGEAVPDWPWKGTQLSAEDMSEGASPIYAEFKKGKEAELRQLREDQAAAEAAAAKGKGKARAAPPRDGAASSWSEEFARAQHADAAAVQAAVDAGNWAAVRKDPGN
ncbi:hypothetical protein BGZ63DRAFT_446950 [Mariannaea sp. PMI_226]|nr:hypothetical protein BGZ63DRAFT_446950 [Mariannaea sp. PMI_226]